MLKNSKFSTGEKAYQNYYGMKKVTKNILKSILIKGIYWNQENFTYKR